MRAAELVEVEGSSLRHRPVAREAEGQAFAAVGGFAVGPGLFGGELEFATEGVQGFVHVFVEQVEEVGGGEAGVGLGEVGVLVFLGEVAEAGDFGGLDAFQGVGGGRRGAGVGLARGEVFVGVAGEAPEVVGRVVDDVFADSEEGTFACAVKEGALGSREDGVEGGDEFVPGGGFGLGAGLFAGAGGFDFTDEVVCDADSGSEVGLFLRGPVASLKDRQVVVRSGGIGAFVGQRDFVQGGAADVGAFGAGLWIGLRRRVCRGRSGRLVGHGGVNG